VQASIPSSNLAGQLLRIRSGRSFADLAIGIPRIQPMNDEVGVPGWSHYSWITEKEVPGANAVAKRGEFRYPLYVRQIEDRFMVVSVQAEVVQHFIVLERLSQMVEKPRVGVGEIVKDSFYPEESPERQGARYRLGAIYASVEGFGRSLRNMSIFGDDLANAALLRQILPQLNPNRVTLRHIKTEMEVLSVNAQGEISFYYKNSTSLSELERALAFLRKNQYLTWRRREL
jgi:hypothetical protein